MTSAQQWAIELFRKKALSFMGADPGEMEVKEEKTRQLEGTKIVSMVLVVGRKGDEGTWGEIVGRYRWHVFFGPRGGVSSYATVRKTEGFGMYETKRYKVHGLHHCLYNYQH